MSDPLADVLAAVQARRVDAYVVGGAVRDRLLGRTCPDIDIALPQPAAPLARDLARETGASFVLMDERRDHARLVPRGMLTGQNAWLDFTSFQGDIIADLARRDFTINAMAVPLGAWASPAIDDVILDPHGGRRDLDAGLVRQVSPASVTDDPVRMVRAVRMAVHAGLTIEPTTREAILVNVDRVTQASMERVRDEVLALLAMPGAGPGVKQLADLGLLDVIIPELAQGRGVTQPKEHYWNVFEHNLETVVMADQILHQKARDNVASLRGRVPWRDGLDVYFQEVIGDGQTRATLVKLAALLHDVGKPARKKRQPDGRIRFLGHHLTGAEMTRWILKRLRCSRRTIAHVSGMVRYHLRPGQISHDREAPTDRAIFRYYRDLEGIGIDTLFLNVADYLAARGPMLEDNDWDRFSRMIDGILSRGFETPRGTKPFLLLNGHEVQEAFGLRPGPAIGRLLRSLREAEAEGRVQTREEALEFLRRQL